MASRQSMKVHVDRHSASLYEVTIVEIDDRGKPQDFAKVSARDLNTALEMAVPYMASVAAEMPFAALL